MKRLAKFLCICEEVHLIIFENRMKMPTIDKPQITWDWTLLSSRRDLTYDENLILKIIHKPIDWKCVSSMKTFEPSVNVLSKLSSYDLHKFLMRQLVWASDKEDLRMNMNNLLDDVCGDGL